MAIRMNVGEQIDINMSVGGDGDYVFRSQHPKKASVNTEGIVTALTPGMVTISIARKSDNVILQELRIQIKRPNEIPQESKPAITFVDL